MKAVALKQKTPVRELGNLRRFSAESSQSVDVPNGDTVYSVFWSLDRLSSQQEETGGVTIAVDGRYVATVFCGSDNIVQNLRGVDLPPTRY